MAKPPANRPHKLLTKSKYIHGLNCKKMVWLEFNAPEEIPEMTGAVKQRMDDGNQKHDGFSCFGCSRNNGKFLDMR